MIKQNTTTTTEKATILCMHGKKHTEQANKIVSDYQQMIDKHSGFPDNYKVSEKLVIKKFIPQSAGFKNGLRIYYIVEYENNRNKQSYMPTFEKALRFAEKYPTYESQLRG